MSEGAGTVMTVEAVIERFPISTGTVPGNVASDLFGNGSIILAKQLRKWNGKSGFYPVPIQWQYDHQDLNVCVLS